MFFFSILSSNVFRVYIFNATLIINLNHISQTNTYPLNLYKMKMVRESILDIDFKKLMQMNRTRYLLIVFSEKITYILYIIYLRKTVQTMPTINYDISLHNNFGSYILLYVLFYGSIQNFYHQYKK